MDNIFLAVKLDGSFANLKIRKPHQQTKPYKSVLEVVSEQSVIELSDVKGTMIVFWTPQFFDTIGVTGFHVHFISSNKAEGGHVIDFTLAEGSVEYQRQFNLDIQLPDDTSYLEKDLAIDDISKIIKHVEN